jgi:hypothetical protein
MTCLIHKNKIQLIGVVYITIFSISTIGGISTLYCFELNHLELYDFGFVGPLDQNHTCHPKVTFLNNSTIV